MKQLKYIALFALILLANHMFSQNSNWDCQDVVHLKRGSTLRGKITEYKIGGDLEMTTWSGLQMHVPGNIVLRVVQKCQEEKADKLSFNQLPYSFDERGWYHATRFSILPGASGRGFSLQHSSGLKINRLVGMGIGAGLETFDPGGTGIATFPIFAEVRGYFLPRKITPFYAIGAGYGFSKKINNGAVIFDGPTERWRGGWMAQAHLGYRIGNHAFVQFGIRFQHKTRTWENSAWGYTNGVDHILHKRLDIGIGLLL